jgi:hypothetical protein
MMCLNQHLLLSITLPNLGCVGCACPSWTYIRHACNALCDSQCDLWPMWCPWRDGESTCPRNITTAAAPAERNSATRCQRQRQQIVPARTPATAPFSVPQHTNERTHASTRPLHGKPCGDPATPTHGATATHTTSWRSAVGGFWPQTQRQHQHTRRPWVE